MEGRWEGGGRPQDQPSELHVSLQKPPFAHEGPPSALAPVPLLYSQGALLLYACATTPQSARFVIFMLLFYFVSLSIPPHHFSSFSPFHTTPNHNHTTTTPHHTTPHHTTPHQPPALTSNGQSSFFHQQNTGFLAAMHQAVVQAGVPWCGRSTQGCRDGKKYKLKNLIALKYHYC